MIGSMSANAAPGDILFSDDFNTNLSQWSVYSASGGNASIGNETSASGTSLRLRWNPISIRSININADVPAAELSLWIRRGDNSFSDSPGLGENFVIHYLNNSNSWIVLDTYYGSGTSGQIYTPTYQLPGDALHSGLQIRLTLTQGSGSLFDNDYWHIDDLVVTERSATGPQVCETLFSDDFNTNLAQWSVYSASGGNASIGNETSASGTSLRLRWNPISIRSIDINADVEAAELSLWIRRGDNSFSDSPGLGENFVIHYLNSSNSWIVLDTYYGSGTAGQIYTPTYTLPNDALHSGLQIRLTLTQGSGSLFDNDYWHIDDVVVNALATNCSCTLGSFSIAQVANALACPSTPAAIDIQAICDDGVTPYEDYQGTVDLASTMPTQSQFFADSSGTTSISSATIASGDNGQARVYLYHQNAAGNVRTVASDSLAAISSTASIGTDFSAAGFAVSVPSNAVCGGSQNVSISAIGQTQTGGVCAVLTGFSGSYDLKAWFTVNRDIAESPGLPDVSATALLIDGSSISEQSSPASNNLPGVNFTSGVATVSLRYDNVGEMLSVNFLHDQAPYDGGTPGISSLLGSAASFVVSPASVIVNETDAADGSCISNDENCTPFVAAGNDFSMTATAVCADGVTVASQYEGEIALSHQLIAPSGGTLGSLAVGTLTITAADNGQRQINNQHISEVGVFSIFATPADYFSVGQAVSSPTTFGRFYPDHFSVQSPLLTNRVDMACTSSFTYMDEAFDVSFSLAAMNAQANVVNNYTSNFALLDDISGNQFGELSLRSIDAATNTPLTLRQNQLAGSSINWSNGLSNVLLRVALSRDSSLVADGPFNSMTLSVLPDDGDASVLASALNADSDADATDDSVLLATTAIYAGRIRGANAYGPESQALDLPVFVERFTGTSWAANADDNCTVISSTWLDFNGGAAPAAGVMNAIPVGSSTSDATFSPATATAGVLGINLSAPGTGGIGNIDVDIDLSSIPWLQFDWDSDALSVDNPPIFTGSFGQYRGNDRIIYRREVLQ